MRAHLVERCPPVIGREFALPGECLDVALEHRKRRAQFVRDVGHKVAADLIDEVQFGHVAGHKQPLALAVGGDSHREIDLRFRGRRDLNGDIRALPTQKLQQFRAAHEVGQALVYVIRPADPQIALGCGVRPLHLEQVVHHHHGIGQRHGRLLKLLQVLAEFLLPLFVPLSEKVDLATDLVEGRAAFRGIVAFAITDPAQQSDHGALLPQGVAEQDARQKPATRA